MIFIIPMLILLFIAGGMKATYELHHYQKYGLSAKKVNALSRPSKNLLEEYHALPDENRPVPNLHHALVALDTKFPNATNHYRASAYGYKNGKRVYYHSWTCQCDSYYRDDCDMKDYVDIHNGIRTVRKNLAEQAHLLELHRVSGGLETAKSLAERLREEGELIETVTKELT